MFWQDPNPYDVMKCSDLNNVKDFVILEKHNLNWKANKDKLELRIIWLQHQLLHF